MKDDALTDDDLLRQARQGDLEALGRLLEAQRAALHRLAVRQLGGRVAARVDASDLIQQTFLEAHRSFAQFAGRDARGLAAWLRGILDHKSAGAVRDHALLQKRDVRRERSLDDSLAGAAPAKQELDACISSPSQKALRREEEERLTRALTSLPADQGEAVRMRHLEGRPLDEIAGRLGRTPAATAGLIKRGMQALRRHMRQGE